MSSVQTPATRWLATIGERIDQIRRDVPQLTQLGEMMAGHLLAGGALFTPQIGTYWPSEFGSRAGGLMGLKPSTYVAESEHDVAFTTLPDPRGRAAADDASFGRALPRPVASPALPAARLRARGFSRATASIRSPRCVRSINWSGAGSPPAK
jgi:hypothetical protein